MLIDTHTLQALAFTYMKSGIHVPVSTRFPMSRAIYTCYPQGQWVCCQYGNTPTGGSSSEESVLHYVASSINFLEVIFVYFLCVRNVALSRAYVAFCVSLFLFLYLLMQNESTPS